MVTPVTLDPDPGVTGVTGVTDVRAGSEGEVARSPGEEGETIFDTKISQKASKLTLTSSKNPLKIDTESEAEGNAEKERDPEQAHTWIFYLPETEGILLLT